jgi:GrpB-like predicted nucleotidyltransferase (UPF0157 family)
VYLQSLVLNRATTHSRDRCAQAEKIRDIMKKTLNDLTKEDWNTLFPIELVDHNPEWKNIYENEKKRILDKVGEEKILRIEHFGSSSITTIKSKPYIDLMIEIPKDLLFDEKLIGEFTELGYSHFKVPARENIKEYSTFGKGYNVDGTKEQIFHIHMCPKDNVMWKQIDFRDYLNANDKRAKEYEDLKLELASKFKNDRGSYVLGKTDFVNETLELIEKKPAHNNV